MTVEQARKELTKRFEGYSDEELLDFVGGHNMPFDRQSAIDESVETSIDEGIDAGDIEMDATDELKCLWDKVKSEGNCKEYVEEMCIQLELFGTETNTLTKQMIHDKLEEVLRKIKVALIP